MQENVYSVFSAVRHGNPTRGDHSFTIRGLEMLNNILRDVIFLVSFFFQKTAPSLETSEQSVVNMAISIHENCVIRSTKAIHAL